MKPIVYTLGEPAGIGADIILQLCQSEVLDNLICVGDQTLLERRAERLGVPIRLRSEAAKVTQRGELCVLHQPLVNSDVCGQPDPRNVPAVLAMLDTAIKGCVDGSFAAVVTGPLHKGVINDVGIPFSGHTEYFAAQTNAPLPVMLLASSAMRVALMTTHLPLQAVSAAITEEKIMQVLRIIEHDFVHKFGIAKPRILVCGLNPHAGEGGHLGREEIDTIIPALQALQAEGLQLQGPIPADTAFTPAYLQQADVIVAMYHDQGLPVLKSHGFGDAANITLGLPIVRTSVDHGTAFDLAGSGKSDVGSLQTAIQVAREMSANSQP